MASFSKETAESLDRRGSYRRSLSLMAPFSKPTTGELPVRVLDISQGGLLLEIEDAALSVGDHIEVELPEGGRFDARVAWERGSYFGCQFSQPVSTAAISAALLKADPRVVAELARASAPHDSSTRVRFGPELNFSLAFALALALWVLIGLAVYAMVE